MIGKFLKGVFLNKGEKCPKCGETTDIDKQNGIWHCYRCDYEW